MLENYEYNKDGLIKQIHREPFSYDKGYVEERYNTYGELNEWMSHLRLGYVIGGIGYVPESLVDVGYGNGAFLKTCSKLIPRCFGFDVSGYPLPDNVTFLDNWLSAEVDVVTFFDVLEHFEDPYILSNCKAKYIIISMPWCHYTSDKWFETWKHRRPNEHLWHFEPKAMENFARAIGYEMLQYHNVEDSIRKASGAQENILSVTLRRRTAK